MKFNIWKDYPRKPLPELLSFIVDNRGKSVPTSEDGTHILIATNCIRNENLYPTYEKVRYFSDDVYNTWFRAHPIPGDIIFVNKGTPGRTCLVPDPIDFSIAQDMMAFRTNEKVLHNRYLLCVLRSHEIQEQIRLCSVGDTIPHFKKQFLDQLMIPIPPLEVQKCIADMYFGFSDKIALNQQINKNLEEQIRSRLSQMLSNAKVAHAKLGEYLYIKGRIGWKGLKKSEYLDYSPYRIINGESLTKNGIDWNKAGYISKERYLESPEIMLQVGDILMSKDGTIGKIGYIDSLDAPTSVASGIFVIRNQQPEIISTVFIYFIFLSSWFNQFIVARTEGSVIPHLYQKDFMEFEFPMPSLTEMKRFDKIAIPMFDTIINNLSMNKKLAAIRDALLPRLMSGEIDVSGIEIK